MTGSFWLGAAIVFVVTYPWNLILLLFVSYKLTQFFVWSIVYLIIGRRRPAIPLSRI